MQQNFSSVEIFGRADEIRDILDLLSRTHKSLITLTGLGGIGKTTLAKAVAQAWSHTSQEPFYFCVLASLQVTELLPVAIAQALHLQIDAQTSERTLIEHLSARSKEKAVLLVLDNIEHLITAANFLTDLQDSCENLKLLVTSREVLQIHREVIFEVPSLALPEEHSESIVNNPSVALFLRQAQRVLPAFQLKGHEGTVAEICRRLEGIPLAIELAAARLQLFSPDALLQRLEQHRLHVLSSVRRDLPVRQRTLRNTLEWSYNLLTSC
jgi:predicted ATPase